MKDGPCWLREEQEEKEGAKLQRRQHLLPAVAHSYPRQLFFFFFSSCSCLFPGELFRQWGSHLGQIETSISHNKQENQKSIRVELFSPALSGVHTPRSITHAWKRSQPSFPSHKTCHVHPACLEKLSKPCEQTFTFQLSLIIIHR